MDVSIVIVSYNTRDLLRQCIESISETTKGISYEIIVVDNNSADDSVLMLAVGFPWIKILRNDRNVGFAAAQNRGLAEAHGRFCLVLNSDILFRQDAVSSMVAFMEGAHTDIGAVGPRILNSDGSLAASARRNNPGDMILALSIINRHFAFARFLPQRAIRKWFAPVFAKVHDNFGRHDSIAEAGYLDGMCVLIRREVLEQVGLFDEQFFFDFEIMDWCVRAKKQDWKLLYYPETEVIHLGHASRRLVKQIIIETHRSELIYFAKHFPRQVRLARLTTLFIVGIRYVTSSVGAALFRSASSAQSKRIYSRILEVARTFNPAGVARDGILPARPVKETSTTPNVSIREI